MFDLSVQEILPSTQAPCREQQLAPPPRVARGHNIKKVQRYLAGLKARGQGLPAGRKGGRPRYAQIAETLNIALNSVRCTTAILELLREHHEKYGTEVHARPAPKRPSLAAAETYAVSKRKHANTAAGMSRAKDIPAVRNVFRAAAGSDRFGGHGDAEQAIARLATRAEGSPQNIPAAVRRELSFVSQCVRELIESGGLPPALGPRIAVCLAEAGVGHADAAAEIGTDVRLLRTWIAGAMPALKSLPFLEALEKLCRRPAGTLTKLVTPSAVSFGDIPLRFFPEDIRGPEHSVLREAMSNLLPAGVEFVLLAPATQERLMGAARERCRPLAQLSAVRAAMLRDRYAVREWPALADAQWREWVQHHQGGVPHFLKRAKTRWSDSTARIYRGVLSDVFGAAVSEDAGPLRLKVEDVDFATIMADPRYVQLYIDRKSAKRKVGGGTDDVTTFDAGLHGLFAASFERNGWARQSAYIRDGMGCARMPDAEWAFKCEELSADYRERSQDTLRKAQHTVPIHCNVREALKSTNPMLVVKALAEGLAAAWLAESDTKERAKILQDLIHVQFQAQVAFRPGTTARLTWLPDNSGDLKRDAEGWYLDVERRLFKNYYTPRLAHGFKRRLIDQWGLYDQLDAFLREGRETLLAGVTRSSPYLFFFGACAIKAAAEGRVRTGADMVSDLSHAITKRTRSATKGVFRVAKIPGVIVLAPTDFRDILATTVLKQHAMSQSPTVRSNGIRLAADAIADNEETIELHYVQYLPEERAAELMELQRSAGAEKSAGGCSRKRRAA